MKQPREKQAFFDDIAPQWIRDTDMRSAQLGKLFAQYALPCEGPVLDIGSGTGILQPHLLRNGAHCIVQLEISGEMLRMNRRLHESAPHTHLLQSDAHCLPIASSSFASVHCFSVYPHFDSPELVLREIRRCLLTGGSLCILHLMNHEQLNDLHREAGRAVAEDVLPPVDRLAETVANHGFTITQAEERRDLYLLLASSD